MGKVVSLLLVVLALGLVAGGCGGGDESETDGTASACRTDTVARPGLPADFPAPEGLVLTSSEQAGPTLVVDGYWDAGLEDAYDELKQAVDASGYTVLFMEQEEHDAEIAYEASDTSGLIALRDDCSEADTTRVHVTSRPK